MSSDYDWSRFTPLDNTGNYSIFKSAYKNMRFQLPVAQKYIINQGDMANLPGIAFKLFGDVCYWRILLEYNAVTDSIDDVYPGLVLNIPRKADVIALLSRQQRNAPTFVNLQI